MGEIKGLCRRVGYDAPSGAFLSAIKVPNVASSDDDILPRISPDFRGILGNPWVSEMAPFL